MGKRRTAKRKLELHSVARESKGALDPIRRWIHRMARTPMVRDVCFLILGAVIGGVITWVFSQVYFERSRSLVHVAMQRKIPQLQTLPAFFKVGTNLVLLNGPGQRMKISNISPYTYEVSRDGTILLAGEVKDIQGRVVAHLQDSNLYVSPGMNYDVNSDMEAIEIVDEKLQPILQLRKLSADEIKEFIAKIPQRMPRLAGVEVLEVYHVSYGFVPGDSKPRVEIADQQGLTITGDTTLVRARIRRPVAQIPHPS
jgi:hypothetical protein